jgi:hypothetical protein
MKQIDCSRSVMTAALLGSLLACAPRLLAQARDIPSAAPTLAPGQTPEQRGHALIDEMIEALGGRAWLDRTSIQQEGRTAAFFSGRPTGSVVEFREFRRLPVNGQTEADRIEFTKKRDIIQVWTGDGGYEITYKGNNPLPKDQVEDVLRRRAHSIEEVVRSWIHAPGVMIVAEGTTMVERRQAETVTVLTANNDAVTIDLDATTHLPLRRTFQWRNQQFKDHDEDAEEYDDYHPVQGLQTAMTITRYRNGDMISQRFIYKDKLIYNAAIAPAMFDPTIPLHPKK